MRCTHNGGVIDAIRAFLVTLEEGSLNRAAKRLRMSQSALSRKMQSLEHELGGSLFERGPQGVRATDLGYVFSEKMREVVEGYDAVWSDLRQRARGQHDVIKIGYIGSAANRYLTPALAKLRKEFPDLQLSLMDLTPGEQMKAIRQGNLDVALIGQEGMSLDEEFYSRKVATLDVCMIVPDTHPTAASETASLKEFSRDFFAGTSEEHVPGRNHWIDTLCRKAGFRAKFIAYTSSIDEVYSIVAGNHAVSIVPDYFCGPPPAGTKRLTLSDPWAKWDFLVLRQRGVTHKASRRLVELIAT